MLITNKTAHPIGLPHADGRGGRSVFLLRPGANDVPPAKWDAIKEACGKSLDRMFTAGKIEEPDKGTPEAAVAIDSLEKFSAKEAARLVDETTDPALLMRWLDGEKRARIVKALEARLEAVTKPGSESDEAAGIKTVGENAGENDGATDTDGEEG